MTENRILIVEDQPNVRKALLTALRRENYMATAAIDATEALDLVAHNEFAAAITDIKLPGDLDGFGLLERITQSHPEVPVIVITAYGSIDGAVRALKLGAAEYITKPFESVASVSEVWVDFVIVCRRGKLP